MRNDTRSTVLRALLFLLVASIASWIGLAGCAVTTNLSDLTGGQVDADATALYSIGGMIRGLEGSEITLANNTNDAVTVASDGAFGFPLRLAVGDKYIVTVLRTSDERTCTIEGGVGVVGSADVTDVVVSCPSMDARLSSLVVSKAGALVPEFAPSTTDYVVAVSPDVFAVDAPVRLTATAASAGAAVTTDGAKAMSGQEFELAGIHYGAGNTVTVTVTAANRIAQTTYKIAMTLNSQEAYIKASNTRSGAQLGHAVALSADGNTLAVGARNESTIAAGAGAVYVFRRVGTTWTEDVVLRPLTTTAGDAFGYSVAMSSDGNTLAVGSYGEASNATGINGDPTGVSAPRSGAAYVFRRGASWTQEVYLKASNSHMSAGFGEALALTADGNMLAVGSAFESSAATGINGDQSDTTAGGAGAVYAFTRQGTTWEQDAYIKASNARPGAEFGTTVALASDGSTLVVGAMGESGAGTGINPDQSDGGLLLAGASYVFSRAGTTWTQEAFIKASNTRSYSRFGSSIALSSDGTKLAVGAPHESGASAGVDGNQADGSADRAGAVYIFAKSGKTWAREAYLKASNTMTLVPAKFGYHLALSGDGRKLIVGAVNEQSRSSGINGDQVDLAQDYSGAAYAFLLAGTKWSQRAFVKPSNTHGTQYFGWNVALSTDGLTLAIGATGEASAERGINRDQTDVSAPYSGAVYVFH